MLSPLTDPETRKAIDMALDLAGDPAGAYALQVKGRIPPDALAADGDLVVLRRQSTAQNGDMVAVWLRNRGQTMLTRYYREGRRIRLRSAGAHCSPDRIEHEANVLVQGKVVTILRPLA